MTKSEMITTWGRAILVFIGIYIWLFLLFV